MRAYDQNNNCPPYCKSTVHFRSDYDILGHDKASFPKIGFIWVGYVIVKDFCQVSILFSLACYIKLKSNYSWKSTFIL